MSENDSGSNVNAEDANALVIMATNEEAKNRAESINGSETTEKDVDNEQKSILAKIGLTTLTRKLVATGFTVAAAGGIAAAFVEGRKRKKNGKGKSSSRGAKKVKRTARKTARKNKKASRKTTRKTKKASRTVARKTKRATRRSARLAKKKARRT